MRVCNRCQNSDEKYFAQFNGKRYCRKCIAFPVQKELKAENVLNGRYELPYPLTERQESCSQKILDTLSSEKDVLVHAVCGSGKTEIVYAAISNFLSSNQKVGFAIPRKDVVLEIAERIKKHFLQSKLIAVYGGHSEEIEGDIVVCTTHQLYRYKNYFGLLIIDEIDAFPFKGNKVLMEFARQASRRFIYLSATPPKEMLDLVEQGDLVKIDLSRRYHNFLLPVPKIIKVPQVISLFVALKIIRKMVKSKKQVFIFAPTIKLAQLYYGFYRMFIKNISLVHSKVAEREEIIKDFKKEKIKVLITTSILERGVTMERLQVIVLNANHELFNKDVLIQIAGRAGRKRNDPIGEVYFLAWPSEAMKKAVMEIQKANAILPDML